MQNTTTTTTLEPNAVDLLYRATSIVSFIADHFAEAGSERLSPPAREGLYAILSGLESDLREAQRLVPSPPPPGRDTTETRQTPGKAAETAAEPTDTAGVSEAQDDRQGRLVSLVYHLEEQLAEAAAGREEVAA